MRKRMEEAIGNSDAFNVDEKSPLKKELGFIAAYEKTSIVKREFLRHQATVYR